LKCTPRSKIASRFAEVLAKADRPAEAAVQFEALGIGRTQAANMTRHQLIDAARCYVAAQQPEALSDLIRRREADRIAGRLAGRFGALALAVELYARLGDLPSAARAAHDHADLRQAFNCGAEQELEQCRAHRAGTP